ncbi:MAG TPA: patatin-like phospholipase family protein [Rhodocyclaceae bacterium]|nr:patatin-like phospholipase family protein [Rhodocyclaceae bacterium]
MSKKVILPQQNVLIFQGGGALGAFQAGVFDGLHEAGLAADWVIGTSIGAVNAAIIAGNRPQRRLEYLHEFWARMGQGWFVDAQIADAAAGGETWAGAMNAINTMALGLPNFFLPRWAGGFAFGLAVAPDNASLYDTTPLKATLEELIDFDYLNQSPVRISLGAVDVESGEMRYFDSRRERIGVEHLLASGALPPAFPAVEIDGRHYWDGGIHSNTPLEFMLRDTPRRHSLCFMATLWQQEDVMPTTLSAVLRRNKELQFASRSATLIGMEQEMHRLRHGIWLLAKRLPAEARADAELAASIELGCRSVYHLVRLQAPRLGHENQTKDIDFAPSHIEARWRAGREDLLRVVATRCWESPVGPEEGVVLHNFEGAAAGRADPQAAENSREKPTAKRGDQPPPDKAAA